MPLSAMKTGLYKLKYRHLTLAILICVFSEHLFAGENKTDEKIPVESTISFRGWANEKPLMRIEEIFADDRMEARYFFWGMTGGRTFLKTDEKTGEIKFKKGIEEGKVLIKDFKTQGGDTSIKFTVIPDDEKLKVLESKLEQGETEGINDVPSLIRIEVDLRQKNKTKSVKWEKQVSLSPSMGESGFVYEPPAISDAFVSPKESLLLVRFVGGGLPRFLLMDLGKQNTATFLTD